MLTEREQNERWEYRRAHRGDTAEWSQAPAPGAIAQPGESMWRTTEPPVP